MAHMLCLSTARWLLLASAAAIPSIGWGFDVPGIGGHMTDPQHRLSDGDKSAIEDKLSKIQEDTHIDVAGWISNGSEADATAMGEAAFREWGIGKDWDNGVFLLIPASGRVRVVLNPDKPMLSPSEAASLADADDPQADLRPRLEKLADKAREMLGPKTANQVRPRGTAHPERGRWYALGAMIIAAAAFGTSIRRWRERPGPRAPAPAPETPPAARAIDAPAAPGPALDTDRASR